VLALITLINLRGTRESGRAFAVPTYLFLGTMAMVLVYGAFKFVISGGHPTSEVPLAHDAATGSVSAWLLVRAFASGCTSMTGVEAVSNGVPAFREPAVKNAQRTLTVLVVALSALLLGIAGAVIAYDITATVPGREGYQSVLSMVVSAIAGRGWLYFATMAGVLSVLCLSANTSFAGFPRLCRQLAEDQYLPVLFRSRGRRLVYSIGVGVLAAHTAILLIVFAGVTDRLIPLFAVGALLAFTLSQAGMVRHAQRAAGSKFPRKAVVNLIGAICTAIALVVVLIAKFMEGAWVSLLFIAATVWVFSRIRRHYRLIDTATANTQALTTDEIRGPIVVMPYTGWNKVSEKALRVAMSLSKDVRALHISIEDDEDAQTVDDWSRFVRDPIRAVGGKEPKLWTVSSPYRHLARPLLKFLREISLAHPDVPIIVVIPELVERKWYRVLLHSQRASILKAKLLFHGGRQVSVLNVPWYLG
jgi:hypothetical protein